MSTEKNPSVVWFIYILSSSYDTPIPQIKYLQSLVAISHTIVVFRRRMDPCRLQLQKNWGCGERHQKNDATLYPVGIEVWANRVDCVLHLTCGPVQQVFKSVLGIEIVNSVVGS